MNQRIAHEGSVADTIAISLGRAMNRRRMIGRALQTALVVGTAIATPVFTARQASATHTCGPGGQTTRWGCGCASTASCPSTKCSTSGCNGIRKRCNYWTSANPLGNYCWCSAYCCYGGLQGYWQCCDCWNGTGTAGCGTSSGQSACICKRRSNNFYCS